MSDDGKYASEEYLKFDPFGGDDDATVRHHRTKLVRTRRRQFCCFCRPKGRRHPIGTVMLRESAVVDGRWASNYVCLPCMDEHCLDDADDGQLKRKPPGRRVLKPASENMAAVPEQSVQEARIRELLDRLCGYGIAPFAPTMSERHELRDKVLEMLP
jgi:hypothetical protein